LKQFPFPRPLHTAIPYLGGWLAYVQDSAAFSRSYGTIHHLDSNGNQLGHIPLQFIDGAIGAVGVQAMVTDGDTLYLAGDFVKINGVERQFGAALKISTGELLPWNPHANGRMRSIALSKNSVFLSGFFDTVSNTYVRDIARVARGTGELQPWPTPIPHQLLNSRSIHSNRKIIVQGNLLFTTNGSLNIETGELGAWKPSPLLLEFRGAPFFISDIAVSNGVVYVVGDFTSMNNQPRNGMAAFSAESGELLPWDPNSGWRSTSIRDLYPSVVMLQVMDTIAYCSGSINNIAGKPINGIAAVSTKSGALLDWNPIVPKYRLVEGGILTIDSPIRILAASRTGVVLVTRRTGTIGEAFTERRGFAEIDLRTGSLSDWNPIFSSRGVRDTFYVHYAHIHAFALQGSTLYVGGVFDSVNGIPRSRLCAFDLNTRELLAWNPKVINGTDPDSDLDSVIQDVVATPHAIYVMGTFDSIGGKSQRYLAAVDPVSGERLSLFSPQPNRPLSTMAYGGGRLYVGGLFNKIGEKVRNGFAVLDGSSGEVLEEGPSFPSRASVRAIAVSESELYLSGDRMGSSVTPLVRPITGDGNSLAGYDRTTGAVRWLPKYPVPTNTGANQLQLGSGEILVSGLFNRALYGAKPGQWDSSNNGMVRLDAQSGEVKGEWPLIGGMNFLEWSDTLVVWELSPDEQQGLTVPYLSLLTNRAKSGVGLEGGVRGAGSLLVYPNPTVGRVEVEWERGEEEELVVMTVVGEVVVRERLHEGRNVVELGTYSEGVYLLKAGKRTALVVLQR